MNLLRLSHGGLGRSGCYKDEMKAHEADEDSVFKLVSGSAQELLAGYKNTNLSGRH